MSRVIWVTLKSGPVKGCFRVARNRLLLLISGIDEKIAEKTALKEIFSAKGESVVKRLV